MMRIEPASLQKIDVSGHSDISSHKNNVYVPFNECCNRCHGGTDTEKLSSKSSVHLNSKKKDREVVIQPQFDKKNDEYAAYDKNKIILRNIPSGIEKHHLILYLEYLSNECEVDLIYDSKEYNGTIMAIYKKELDLRTVQNRHRVRPKLERSELELCLVEYPKTIMIVGISKNLTKDFLELYFGNSKRSGGSGIVSAEIKEGEEYALVTFERPDIVQNVLKQEHFIDGRKIKAYVYYPSMGAEPFGEEHSKFFPRPLTFNFSSDLRLSVLKKSDKSRGRLEALLQKWNAVVSFDLECMKIVCVGNADLFRTIQSRNEWEGEVLASVKELLNYIKTQSITLKEDLQQKVLEEISKVTKNEAHVHVLENELQIAADEANFSDVYDAIDRIIHPEKRGIRATAEVKGHHLDVLMKFLNSARETYPSLSIDIDKKLCRVSITGDEDEVNACKDYFRSIVKRCTRSEFKLSPELLKFMSYESNMQALTEKLLNRGIIGAITLSGDDPPKLAICSPSSDQAKIAYRDIKHLVITKGIRCLHDSCSIFDSQTWQDFLSDALENLNEENRTITIVHNDGCDVWITGFRSEVYTMVDLIRDFLREENCSFFEV